MAIIVIRATSANVYYYVEHSATLCYHISLPNNSRSIPYDSC